MAKQCHSRSKLRLDPVRLSKTAWYYEEPQGIYIVAEKRDLNEKLIAITQTVIDWHKLRSSLARHDA